MATIPHVLTYGRFFGARRFHIELPGFSVSLLTPALRPEDVPVHSHTDASFVFLLSGSYTSEADGFPAICHPSTLIFNPAGITHRDRFTSVSGRFLTVSISRRSLHVGGDELRLPSASTAFASGGPVAAALRLTQECFASEGASSAQLEGTCWELLGCADARKAVWRESLPPWVSRSRELLHDLCVEPLHIADAARQLGVHPVYFARAFKRAYRCTPSQYLVRCRLQKAMSLLDGSRLPLCEIALRAGFFDQSHFSRAFKQHFGVPPKLYRRQLQGNLKTIEV